jgi:hypothetical protein
VGRGWAPAGQTRRRVVANDGAAREMRRERGEPTANMGGGERGSGPTCGHAGRVPWFCRQNARG